MPFDPKTYTSLIEWADIVISQKKLSNLSGADIINDAYLKSVSEGIDFTEAYGKKQAMSVLYGEIKEDRIKGRNYLEFGQGNPNWKGYQIDSDQKECITCHEIKPSGAYYFINNGSYVATECKECWRKRTATNLKNPDRKIGVKKTNTIRLLDESGNVLLEANSPTHFASFFDKHRNVTNSQILGIRQWTRWKKPKFLKSSSKGINNYL